MFGILWRLDVLSMWNMLSVVCVCDFMVTGCVVYVEHVERCLRLGF